METRDKGLQVAQVSGLRAALDNIISDYEKQYNSTVEKEMRWYYKGKLDAFKFVVDELNIVLGKEDNK